MPPIFNYYIGYEMEITDTNGDLISEMADPISYPLLYMATGGQDNLYYHEILKEDA
jgi:hypothetical protein